MPEALWQLIRGSPHTKNCTEKNRRSYTYIVSGVQHIGYFQNNTESYQHAQKPSTCSATYTTAPLFGIYGMLIGNVLSKHQMFVSMSLPIPPNQL